MATTYEIRLFVSSKFYILFVSLSFTLRIQSTFLNIEELQKSRYGVEISAKPVLLNNQVILRDLLLTYYMMLYILLY